MELGEVPVMLGPQNQIEISTVAEWAQSLRRYAQLMDEPHLFETEALMQEAMDDQRRALTEFLENTPQLSTALRNLMYNMDSSASSTTASDGSSDSNSRRPRTGQFSSGQGSLSQETINERESNEFLPSGGSSSDGEGAKNSLYAQATSSDNSLRAVAVQGGSSSSSGSCGKQSDEPQASTGTGANSSNSQEGARASSNKSDRTPDDAQGSSDAQASSSSDGRPRTRNEHIRQNDGEDRPDIEVLWRDLPEARGTNRLARLAPQSPGRLAGHVTSLLVHNVPWYYTQEDLLRKWPLDGTYDFLHLRSISPSEVIVNFVAAEYAAAFHRRWQGAALCPEASAELLSIVASTAQGRNANLMLVLDDTPIPPILFIGNMRLADDRVRKLVELAKVGVFLCAV